MRSIWHRYLFMINRIRRFGWGAKPAYDATPAVRLPVRALVSAIRGQTIAVRRLPALWEWQTTQGDGSDPTKLG